jgi:hypothetical protein
VKSPAPNSSMSMHVGRPSALLKRNHGTAGSPVVDSELLPRYRSGT